MGKFIYVIKPETATRNDKIKTQSSKENQQKLLKPYKTLLKR